jgi:hypothetical protein
LSYKDDSLKRIAVNAVNNAVAAGRLVRPKKCEDCNQPGRGLKRPTIHGHHIDGYEFPLRVRWLCPTCHAKYDTRACGEKHGRSKLTSDQVDEIRGRHNRKNCNTYQLAIEYAMSPAQIQRIVAGREWREVKP